MFLIYEPLSPVVVFASLERGEVWRLCMPRRPWFHSSFLKSAFIFGLELWVGSGGQSEIILSSHPSLYARSKDNLLSALVRRWRERAAFENAGKSLQPPPAGILPEIVSDGLTSVADTFPLRILRRGPPKGRRDILW